jgi:hypothetical protein
MALEGMVSLMPRHRRDSSPASPQYQLNDANEAPRTQVNKRGSAPMPCTWHGRWGIGHTPNRECAHIPVAPFPFANLLYAGTTRDIAHATYAYIRGVGSGEPDKRPK